MGERYPRIEEIERVLERRIEEAGCMDEEEDGEEGMGVGEWVGEEEDVEDMSTNWDSQMEGEGEY